MATVDTTPGHRQGLERDQTTGTGDGIRTHTDLRPAVFKTAAATITPPRPASWICQSQVKASLRPPSPAQTARAAEFARAPLLGHG